MRDNSRSFCFTAANGNAALGFVVIYTRCIARLFSWLRTWASSYVSPISLVSNFVCRSFAINAFRPQIFLNIRVMTQGDRQNRSYAFSTAPAVGSNPP